METKIENSEAEPVKIDAQHLLDKILKRAKEEEKKRRVKIKNRRILTHKVQNCLCCGSVARVIELKNEQDAEEKSQYIVTCMLCARHTTEKDNTLAAIHEWDLMQKLYEKSEAQKANERELEAEEEKQIDSGLGLSFSLSPFK